MTEKNTTPNKTPRRLRRRAAAEYLGTSEGFLEKLALHDAGPPMIRLSRRLIVYDLRDLDAWLAERRVRNTSEATAASTK
jgi:hypothetical protein